MTIIVYDGTWLASDDLFTDGEGFKSYGRKIFKGPLSKGILAYGCAGDAVLISAFSKWINDGIKTTPLDYDEADFTALAVCPHGEIRIYFGYDEYIVCQEDVVAIGNGRAFIKGYLTDRDSTIGSISSAIERVCELNCFCGISPSGWINQPILVCDDSDSSN